MKIEKDDIRVIAAGRFWKIHRVITTIFVIVYLTALAGVAVEMVDGLPGYILGSLPLFLIAVYLFWTYRKLIKYENYLVAEWEKENNKGVNK